MEIDEKISVRFERNDLKSLDRLIKSAGYSSRSEFIRHAVIKQMTDDKKKDCVSVEVPALVMGYINALVEKGFYRSKEHAIHIAIDNYFNHERVESALKAAKGMELVAGRRIDYEVDRSEKKVVEK